MDAPRDAGGHAAIDVLRQLPRALGLTVVAYAAAALLFAAVGWLTGGGPLALLAGGLLLLAGAAYGGSRLRTWWWVVLYPLPMVAGSLLFWHMANELSEAWERGEGGSFVAALAFFLAILFAVGTLLTALTSLVGVAVAKARARRRSGVRPSAPDAVRV